MPTWSQDACISALALSLLHSLWQGAILGLVGFALTPRLRRSTPDVRYTTYSLLLVALFAVWIGTFCSLYGASARSAELTHMQTGMLVFDVEALPAAVAPAGLWTVSRLQPLFPLVVALWAVGVCVLSLRHLGGLLMLQSMCRAATDSCPPEWTAFAERIAAEMGIRRQVLLRCSSRIDVPCAFGVFRSYILLPLGVMAGLTPQQTEALIAHELAHLARHDVLFNIVQVCMETVLFYHPAVRWLSMQVRVAREQRCDDLAIQFLGDRVVYARALFSLEEARAPIPRLALGARGENSHMSNTHLVTRIQRVLGVSGPERRDPWIKGVIALGAVAAGLAMLHPVHALDTAPTAAVASSSSVRLNRAMLVIDGDMIELDGDTVTADSLVTVNGKQGRFGDLTPAQQKEIQEALASAPHGDTMMLTKTLDGGINIVRARKADVRLNINGDVIESSGADLSPNSLITVNGKPKRVGDLTEAQQKQLKEAVDAVPALPMPGVLGVATADGGASDILFSMEKAVLNVDGTKYEIEDGELTSETAVTVNGKVVRFGDMPVAQQEKLRKAFAEMPRRTINLQRASVAVSSRAIPAGAATFFKAALNINGDEIEIDTPELTADTIVKVNGKSVRFGDLTSAQQKQLKEAIPPMPLHATTIMRTMPAVPATPATTIP